ncbi:MAG: hypothetical protein ACOYOF_09640 [Verrucomicrobiaceae bacterium]
MSDDKITRLAGEALRLKKALVMSIALLGRPANVLQEHLNLPNYSRWQIKPLKSHIDELRVCLNDIGRTCGRARQSAK